MTDVVSPSTSSEGGVQVSPSTSSDDPSGSPSKERDSSSASKLTPTRRNKRKMTEPKKRTDFSIKRFCPDNSDDSDSGMDVDVEGEFEDLKMKPRKLENMSPTREPRALSRGDDDSSRDSRDSLNSTIPDQKGIANITPNLQSAFIYPTSENLALYQRHLTHVQMQMGGVEPPSPRLDSPELHPPLQPPLGRRGRKNYKNMTRERRVEANARERSRVHTISAAFDSLRRAVPSYSYNQKLSKLAILRIACSYIMSLARLADLDYSPDQRNYSFADCVDLCTRTIQTEGRARRRH